MFWDQKETLECRKCGYAISSPYPTQCPKCKTVLNLNSIEIHKNKEQSKLKTKQNAITTETPTLQFLKNLKIGSNPDIVSSFEDINKKKQQNEIQQISISKASIANEKIKIKENVITKVQVDKEKVALGNKGEYLKYIGLTTKNREEIYSLNTTFTYLLDLAVNLEYISTSILSGQLDRMQLISADRQSEETCYFSEENEVLIVIYGDIPEKKANWISQQIKISIKDYIEQKKIASFNKLEMYTLSQKFNKRVKFLIESCIELNDVITSEIITSVDNYLRLDYFGLSYQSVGIISKLITDLLEIQDLPNVPDNSSEDFDNINELKEALITAKVEAIAANTFANTLMTPAWITVKLGFQHYRYMLFQKINDYYVSLLAEGNLQKRSEIFGPLSEYLKPITDNPFMGILSEYQNYTPDIVKYIKKLNDD